MMKVLTKKQFSLFEIDDECKCNFKQMHWSGLSDFQSEALMWVGDVFRQKGSQHFWCDGAYCWYTDDAQNHEQCVWQTENGILIFEDITFKKLYRVKFNN